MEELLLSIIKDGFGIWFLFFTYTAIMIVIYWFGLPKFIKNKASYIEKPISHGIVTDNPIMFREYDSYLTEANIITILGILGLVFATILAILNQYTITIPFFFITAVVISDWLDGLACIRHDCHSKIGAKLDPMRDRLAIILLVTVLLINESPYQVWLMVIALGIIEISSAIIVILNKSKQFVHSSGKIRQAFHLISILSILGSIYFLKTLSYDLSTIIVTISVAIMLTASISHFLNLKEKK